MMMTIMTTMMIWRRCWWRWWYLIHSLTHPSSSTHPPPPHTHTRKKHSGVSDRSQRSVVAHSSMSSTSHSYPRAAAASTPRRSQLRGNALPCFTFPSAFSISAFHVRVPVGHLSIVDRFQWVFLLHPQFFFVCSQLERSFEVNSREIPLSIVNYVVGDLSPLNWSSVSRWKNLTFQL